MRESLKDQQAEFCLDQFHLLPDPFVSSQGTEVNKISTSYISVVSPQKKKKKKKKRKKKKRKEKIKKGSGARLVPQLLYISLG